MVLKKKYLKKAVVFSMISFLISTLFVVMFLRQDSASIDFLADSNSARISTINDFISSYELYIQDAIKISTISSLNNITERITNRSIPDTKMSNPSSVIVSCLQGDKVSGNTCTGSNSFEELLSSFESLTYDLLGVKVSHTIVQNSLSVEQTSPFYLSVSMQINYTVIDPEFAYWSRTKLFNNVLVPITGLRDPLYEWRNNYLKEGANHRIIVDNDVFGHMNATEFKSFVYNSTYIFMDNSSYNKSPSYLQRLSNLTLGSSSLLGIESVITPSNISSSYPVAAINRSYADYQIFELKTWSCDWDNGGTLIGINSSELPGLPSKLRFDQDTFTSTYGLNGTYQNLTCN